MSKPKKRHKVFISYHHENDQSYKDSFLRLFGKDGADILEDRSVGAGDVYDNLKTETIRQKIRDEYIRDASVVVVLIGKETWKRKHVDWEISSGIRGTKSNSRCGLLGIFLPTHKAYGKDSYSRYTIPPRLYDNRNNKYAKLYDWSDNHEKVSQWIHKAFQAKDTKTPHNSRKMFGQNRTGDQWSD